MSRSDLTKTLQGLDRHLKIACDMPEFKRGDRWQDLDIMNWRVVEQLQEPIQIDGVSCGLFMLNCIEYWTGDILSDHFTQEDMKEFRRKLAVILLETELNKLKGSPIYYRPDNEENVYVSDVEFLGERKRKRQDALDGAKDLCPLPNPIIAAYPHDLVDELCNHIMSINDANSLEKEWVRSSKPHPIGVALLAVDPPVRFMDLQFSTSVIEAAVASARDLYSRVQPDIQALASLLRSSTEIHYNISSCDWMLLAHAYLGHYILFAINKHARQVSILDPLSPSLSPERYALKFQRVAFYPKDALELAQPDWKSDISVWPRKSPIDVPTSQDRMVMSREGIF